MSTIAGAVISSISSRASDRRRALQENVKAGLEREAQWSSELRRAAVEFIVESRDYIKRVENNYRPEGSGSERKWVPIDSPAPVDIRAAYQAYWNLVLLSDAETSGIAKALLREVRRLVPPSPTSVRAVSAVGWERFAKRQKAIIDARGRLAERVIRVAVPAGSQGAHVALADAQASGPDQTGT